MLFKKKETKRCNFCNEKIERKFSFCPYCGEEMIEDIEDADDFGLLGKSDALPKARAQNNENPFGELGISSNMLNSLMGSVMKMMSKELKNINKTEIENTRITQLPNGISISIGGPKEQKAPKEKKAKQKEITVEQLERISKLPKAAAKSVMKRMGDKVIYELTAPGVISLNDILVSKLESGYEVKAIGKTKVYVNTLPELPLDRYGIDKDKLLFEFKTQ